MMRTHLREVTVDISLFWQVPPAMWHMLTVSPQCPCLPACLPACLLAYLVVVLLSRQKEQSLSAAWASVGAGGSAKKLDNVTAPTNQLMAAECDEDCLWNDRNVLNGTAMDAGGAV
jgi:hypothetical protein